MVDTAREELLRKVIINSENLMAKCAQLILDGHELPLTQDDWLPSIQKRADKAFPGLPTPERRFAKAILEDTEARQLYQASKRSPPGRVVIDAPAPVDEMSRRAANVSLMEPARDRMNRAASDAIEAERKTDEDAAASPGEKLRRARLRALGRPRDDVARV